MPALISGSIRRTLAVVVLCAMLPALGIIFWYGVLNYREAVSECRNRAVSMAQALASQQMQFVWDTKLLLTQLAAVAPLRELDGVAATAVLSELSRENPLRSSFFLADRNGLILGSSQPDAVGFNVSDRKYFRDALATEEFSAGEFAVSRSLGGEVIHFAVPVRSVQGRVAGVLAMACSLNSYDRLFSHLPVPEKARIIFMDHKGLRLYRYPSQPDTPLGQPVAKALWMRWKTGPLISPPWTR